MQHTRPISGNRVRSAAASFVMCVGHETIIFSFEKKKKKGSRLCHRRRERWCQSLLQQHAPLIKISCCQARRHQHIHSHEENTLSRFLIKRILFLLKNIRIYFIYVISCFYYRLLKDYRSISCVSTNGSANLFLCAFCDF